MYSLFAIAAGGGAGALLRHFVNTAVTHVAGPDFPLGILVINILGSTLMGGAAGTFAHLSGVPQVWKLFLTVGLLGGFTTFSAFSLDAVLLMEKGQAGAALLYVGGSVLLSLAGLYAGLLMARGLFA